MFTTKARKALDRLPTGTQRRIVDFLDERAASRENPRLLAKRLVGVSDELWRFRVGDFRIITQFKDKGMTIVVIEIGHLRDVYR